MNDWRLHDTSWAPHEVKVFNQKCFKTEKAAISGSNSKNALADACPPPARNVPVRSFVVGIIIIRLHCRVD